MPGLAAEKFGAVSVLAVSTALRHGKKSWTTALLLAVLIASWVSLTSAGKFYFDGVVGALGSLAG